MTPGGTDVNGLRIDAPHHPEPEDTIIISRAMRAVKLDTANTLQNFA